MNAKYYRLGYDRRLGGDYIEYYSEDFKLLGTAKTINDRFGNPMLRETGLPAVNGETRIVSRFDHVSAVLDTEPVEGTDWLVVQGHLKLTDEQRDNINHNVTGTPKRSEALVRAQDKYNERQKRVTFRLDTETEGDLIEKLEAQPSMQAYIKELIRADIKK